jgi:hypothetical protein
VERFADAPFVLLGVNSDGDREAARAKAEELGMNWQSWWDESAEGLIAKQWGIRGWPSIFVLDAQGVVRYTDVRPDQLEHAVDTVLRTSRAIAAAQ